MILWMNDTIKLPGFHPKWDAVTVPAKCTFVTDIICVASGMNILAKNSVKYIISVIPINDLTRFPLLLNTPLVSCSILLLISLMGRISFLVQGILIIL